MRIHTNPIFVPLIIVKSISMAILTPIPHRANLESMKSVLPYLEIILSVILIGAILLQRTGAQVGGAFGGSDNWSSAHHTRRGAEKWLFSITIVVAILFAFSALANLA